MTTLFGEVVYPSSRAFWTEDDEDDNQNIESDGSLSGLFTVQWLQDIPKQIDTLIIAETNLIIDFIKTHLLKKSSEEVCQIKTTLSTKPSKLFKATDNIFICLISPDVDLSQAGDFVDAICDVLKKAENIVAVTSNHISQLKSAEESDSLAFLRSLCTKKTSDARKTWFPTLKQPNIVSGVGAGVVAYAEIMEQSASLNILYLDGYELDSESAAPLIKLLSKVTEHELPEFTCGKSVFNKGNLYM